MRTLLCRTLDVAGRFMAAVMGYSQSQSVLTWGIVGPMMDDK